MWLTAKQVQAVSPPGIHIREVRRLLKASGLAHTHRRRLYLRQDRLEAFIEESFACRSSSCTARRGRGTRKSPASTTSKAPITKGSAYTTACTLAIEI